MVELAISSSLFFTASAIEAKEACPSYAGTTVEELKQQYGFEHDYFFIIGLDALPILTDPERSKTYPGLCSFIATTRPGFHFESLMQHVPGAYRPYIHINEMPAISISSSDIRERVRAGLPIDGMVPDCVRDYIVKFRIYTACFT